MKNAKKVERKVVNNFDSVVIKKSIAAITKSQSFNYKETNEILSKYAVKPSLT